MQSSVCGLSALITASVASSLLAAESWPRVALTDARQVELGGAWGKALQRGVDRLAQPPYTTEWLLSDVSFKMDRIFTNYSGDVSGRFLELASLTSPAGALRPATLQPVALEIAKFQQADGHFGLAMDFSKPMQKLSPPIPMLWGNARLLVGLVTAANRLHDTGLLAAARRLGDFYVMTGDTFCSPAREAELRTTGTGGDGYTCCYFPAIESLALLYRATQEEGYLAQARRMAEWFKKFDALPTDHSHGNLCAWRGMLELYDLTGERAYLERALAKWEMAVQDGYVWPLGGVGEHWYRFHSGDEGCSESDWLRFNLELWRFTGETRFLEMAERLLNNQYAGNQCGNGGYGWRPFDGDADGPIGTAGNLDEWYFCCSFHGPLGLHFLKSYLAAGSSQGILVNFPADFSGTVTNAGVPWRVAVRTAAASPTAERRFDIELRPLVKPKTGKVVLLIRRPEWAEAVRVESAPGKAVQFSSKNGYIRVERNFGGGERLLVAFKTGLRLEHRRFESVAVPADRVSRWRDVALLAGPDVLFATPATAPGRMTLLAQVDEKGHLELWPGAGDTPVTVALPGLACGLNDCSAAMKEAPLVAVRPEPELGTRRRATFMHDVVVVPSNLLPDRASKEFTKRARQMSLAGSGGAFGDHLESKPEAWLGSAGWRFGAEGLRVSGGDVGLLDFNPGADFRFEFDLTLPPEGHGITGWVVRAQGKGDCVLFQVQSADSTYSAPEFKTRPNTLRPHIRRYGEWKIAEPVALPKEVRRGETHHLAVDCRGPQVTVYLDGEKIYSGDDGGFSAGTVGFRASGPGEQGIFTNISLTKLAQ